MTSASVPYSGDGPRTALEPVDDDDIEMAVDSPPRVFGDAGRGGADSANDDEPTTALQEALYHAHLTGWYAHRVSLEVDESALEIRRRGALSSITKHTCDRGHQWCSGTSARAMQISSTIARAWDNPFPDLHSLRSRCYYLDLDLDFGNGGCPRGLEGCDHLNKAHAYAVLAHAHVSCALSALEAPDPPQPPSQFQIQTRNWLREKEEIYYMIYHDLVRPDLTPSRATRYGHVSQHDNIPPAEPAINGSAASSSNVPANAPAPATGPHATIAAPLAEPSTSASAAAIAAPPAGPSTSASAAAPPPYLSDRGRWHRMTSLTSHRNACCSACGLPVDICPGHVHTCHTCHATLATGLVGYPDATEEPAVIWVPPDYPPCVCVCVSGRNTPVSDCICIDGPIHQNTLLIHA